MNLKSKIALAALALTAGTSAMAQLSYNVGAVSDYRFRGIEQSAGQPSVQGGVDYAHSSGFYVGAWAASNIKWVKEFNGASKGDYELDLYGGYKFEVKGVALDVGVISYNYPGNDSGGANTLGGSTNYTKADTIEAYVGATYSVATLKYFQSQGDFLGNRDTNGSRYWDLSATFDLGSGFTLVPHYGIQTIPTNSTSNASNTANYADYALTLTKDFGKGLTASIAAIGTDAKRSFYTSSAAFGNERYYGKDTVVVGVKYAF
ncbi:MAG: TorF family putative porin [Hylemonella sp.]|nr:TorF family putative porin [Hylemonella sp.]